MNILYIAVSCAPNMGSEDKIGWNIPVESAKTNRVFVITLEKQRKAIENYLRKNRTTNIQFYYVDVPEIYKLIFRGFLFSGRLNAWHRRVLPLAREICIRENIQIIHQITPVEFRSIGNYGVIPNVKFVCGPVAGGQKIPRELMGYAGPYQPVEWLRNITNECFRLVYKVTGKVRKCDYLWFANNETDDFLRTCRYTGQRCEVLPDVSISRQDLVAKEDKRNRKHICRKFVVVGRLVHLKGHDLLLDALARIPSEYEYDCEIVGTGIYLDHLRDKCEQCGLTEHVSFIGAVPYTRMPEIYRDADVLVFTSFREATGSVLLEAMSNGLPVVALNRFGGAIILNEETGWLFDGRTKEEYIDNLKSILLECIQNPEEVKRRGQNARNSAEAFTWEKKMQNFQKVYEGLMQE